MFALVVLTVALAAAPQSSEDAAWQRIQRGMNPAQVAQTVGVPLLRNAARGHELWIYDAGAHVQFHGGAVSAWTAPAPKARPTPPVPLPADKPIANARPAGTEKKSAAMPARLSRRLS